MRSLHRVRIAACGLGAVDGPLRTASVARKHAEAEAALRSALREAESIASGDLRVATTLYNLGSLFPAAQRSGDALCRERARRLRRTSAWARVENDVWRYRGSTQPTTVAPAGWPTGCSTPLSSEVAPLAPRKFACRKWGWPGPLWLQAAFRATRVSKWLAPDPHSVSFSDPCHDRGAF